MGAPAGRERAGLVEGLSVGVATDMGARAMELEMLTLGSGGGRV